MAGHIQQMNIKPELVLIAFIGQLVNITFYPFPTAISSLFKDTSSHKNSQLPTPCNALAGNQHEVSAQNKISSKTDANQQLSLFWHST